MHKGTLIDELLAAVERAETRVAEHPSDPPHFSTPRVEPGNNDFCYCKREGLQSEEFPQALSLRTADGDLRLFLVVHPQLVRTLEPGNDFTNAVDIHQVGAVGAPKKIRV
jgi:hypothetical protein